MNADADPSQSPALDPALLEILVCPLTRSKLRLEGDELVAEQPEGAGLRYPIRQGVPVLLAEEATLPDGVADLDAFKRRYASHIPA
ncbi:MAG: Trm112 family protein [Phycisphaeraceae bacterium]